MRAMVHQPKKRDSSNGMIITVPGKSAFTRRFLMQIPGLIPTFPINSSGGYEIWSPTIVKIAVAKRLEVPVGRSQE